MVASGRWRCGRTGRRMEGAEAGRFAGAARCTFDGFDFGRARWRSKKVDARLTTEIAISFYFEAAPTTFAARTSSTPRAFALSSASFFILAAVIPPLNLHAVPSPAGPPS